VIFFVTITNINVRKLDNWQRTIIFWCGCTHKSCNKLNCLSFFLVVALTWLRKEASASASLAVWLRRFWSEKVITFYWLKSTAVLAYTYQFSCYYTLQQQVSFNISKIQCNQSSSRILFQTRMGPMGNDGNDRLYCWVGWISFAPNYWFDIGDKMEIFKNIFIG